MLDRLLENMRNSAFPIGIDLGATGAKLVQLAAGRTGLRVVAMSRVELPECAAEGT